MMRRREFILLLGGAAAAWPLAARAQQREKMRRIGVLMNLAADDAEGQARLAAFLQGLQEAGWAVGRNVRIDLRWGGGDADSFRKQAIQSAASSFGMELAPVGVNDADEIERGVIAFARASNGGLIVTANTLSMVHRELIITLAARHRLPAVYGLRLFVNDGGLISYGPDSVDPHRRAASYVDRILKGEKPADLPVQAPTKFELAINLKTAKALGLEIPPTLLARADEVIE